MSNFFHSILSALGMSIISVGLFFTGPAPKPLITATAGTSTPQVEVVATTTVVLQKPKPVSVNIVKKQSQENVGQVPAEKTLPVVSQVVPTLPKVSLNSTDLPLVVSCHVDQISIAPGEVATWRTDVSGGNGSYNYSWTGSEGLSSNKPVFDWKYNSEGKKFASVTVTSNGQTQNANCSDTVMVQVPILNQTIQVAAPIPVTNLHPDLIKIDTVSCNGNSVPFLENSALVPDTGTSCSLGIIGRVLNSGAQGISNISVQIGSGNNPRITSTDSNGVFRVNSIGITGGITIPINATYNGLSYPNSIDYSFKVEFVH